MLLRSCVTTPTWLSKTLKPEITISGSGPSSEGYGKTTITTKKLPTDSEYVSLRHIHFWNKFRNKDRDRPIMLYHQQCKCKHCRVCTDIPVDWSASTKYWDNYYKQFNPKLAKPSLGTCAVFSAVERWKPKTIGLIGFDWILDGNPDWFHDAEKERQAILSLTNIVDLRDGSQIQMQLRRDNGI